MLSLKVSLNVLAILIILLQIMSAPIGQTEDGRDQYLFHIRILSPGENDIILAKSAPIFFEAVVRDDIAHDVDLSVLNVCMRVNGSDTAESCAVFSSATLLEFTHDVAGTHFIEAWLSANGSTSHNGRPISNVARADFVTADPQDLANTKGLLLEPSKIEIGVLPHCTNIGPKEISDNTCNFVDDYQGRSVVAISGGHDANVAVTIGGRVIFVLELERFFEKRYMAGFGDNGSYDEVRSIWRQIHEKVTHASNRTFFDVGVNVALDSPGGITEWHNTVSRVVRQTFVVRQWIEVDHHRSHALLALYDSPFSRPLILSFDGGGNDGFFLVYHGDRKNGSLSIIDEKKWNLGTAYMRVGAAVSEVVGNRRCKSLIPCGLGFAGKMMGYLALGTVRPEWIEKLRVFFLNPEQPLDQPFPTRTLVGFPLMEADGIVNEARRQAERDFAATAQFVFEDIVLSTIEDTLKKLSVDASGRTVDGTLLLDGIALTGGCALNVLANSRIQEEFSALPVYVPAAPSDCGLAVGAAWHVQAPSTREPLQYMGFDLWDAENMTAVLDTLDAKSVGVDYVAKLIAAKKVIGVIRGRQEFGPRALGHRSLLAFPYDDMKDRMNKLKVREWYRPVAPVFPLEARQTFTNTSVDSPYMSFAPKLLSDLDESIPSVVHFDHTARPQTVTFEQDPWLYDLLNAVGRIVGYPILINTSFNTRGKPILNRLSEALDLLVSLEDLDFILVGDRLVGKAQANAARILRGQT